MSATSVRKKSTWTAHRRWPIEFANQVNQARVPLDEMKKVSWIERLMQEEGASVRNS